MGNREQVKRVPVLQRMQSATLSLFFYQDVSTVEIIPFIEKNYKLTDNLHNSLTKATHNGGSKFEKRLSLLTILHFIERLQANAPSIPEQTSWAGTFTQCKTNRSPITPPFARTPKVVRGTRGLLHTVHFFIFPGSS